MSELGRELDWDDSIEKDSDYVLLPEGDYEFVVESVERARHPGSDKIPPCNKAIVITNSNFTKPAEQLADKCDVQLLDGTDVKKMIAK